MVIVGDGAPVQCVLWYIILCCYRTLESNDWTDTEVALDGSATDFVVTIKRESRRKVVVKCTTEHPGAFQTRTHKSSAVILEGQGHVSRWPARAS